MGKRKAPAFEGCRTGDHRRACSNDHLADGCRFTGAKAELQSARSQTANCTGSDHDRFSTERGALGALIIDETGSQSEHKQTPPRETGPFLGLVGRIFTEGYSNEGFPIGGGVAGVASTHIPMDGLQGAGVELHPKQIQEAPASPIKASGMRKRCCGPQHPSIIGLSTIVEEKDPTDNLEPPIFVEGTPAAIVKPLGHPGSLNVIAKKHASPSAERRRLQHVLEFIGGEQLRERLSAVVEGGDDMVEKLAALLPEGMFPGKAENLEKCYLCDSLYDSTYTKGNMLFVCRGCMSQHRERESLDGQGFRTPEEDDHSCTGDEDCWCFECMEKMPDEDPSDSEDFDEDT